jgi:hypothetical protein
VHLYAKLAQRKLEANEAKLGCLHEQHQSASLVSIAGVSPERFVPLDDLLVIFDVIAHRDGLFLEILVDVVFSAWLLLVLQVLHEAECHLRKRFLSVGNWKNFVLDDPLSTVFFHLDLLD